MLRGMSSVPGESAEASMPGDRRPGNRVEPAHLPPEIITALRRTAQEITARHRLTEHGRCCYCVQTWLHTDTPYPCPPVRIATSFLRLTRA